MEPLVCVPSVSHVELAAAGVAHRRSSSTNAAAVETRLIIGVSSGISSVSRKRFVTHHGGAAHQRFGDGDFSAEPLNLVCPLFTRPSSQRVAAFAEPLRIVARAVSPASLAPDILFRVATPHRTLFQNRRFDMMKIRTLVAAAVLSSTFFAANAVYAQDAQVCQPGIAAAFARHQAAYTALFGAMFTGTPTVQTLTADLNALAEPTYPQLLADAQAMAAKLATGRVVLTLPDGTVAVDTGRPAGTNTWANFQAKTINENHNSRVAIFSAQQYPCGFGLETKASTSGIPITNQSYIAFRAGAHLDSVGTIRMSTTN